MSEALKVFWKWWGHGSACVNKQQDWWPSSSHSTTIIMVKLHKITVGNIGAYRSVWVPGQDLAMSHLMCSCGNSILSLNCMLYVRHDWWPCAVLMIWVRMIQINLGNVRVCPGLQAPMVGKLNLSSKGIYSAFWLMHIWSHPELLILMIETDNTELSTTNALKCPQFFPLQKYRVAMAAASTAISPPMHVIIVIIIWCQML